MKYCLSVLVVEERARNGQGFHGGIGIEAPSCVWDCFIGELLMLEKELLIFVDRRAP